jgi:hypothetical protein
MRREIPSDHSGPQGETYSRDYSTTPRGGPRLAPPFATLPDGRPRFGAGGGGEWTPGPPALALGAQKSLSRR